MSLKRFRQPKVRKLPLDALVKRRDRASILSERARRALVGQISRHGCYPAVVVRRAPNHPGKYEILDGHNRTEILRELGYTDVRCEIWPIDDEEAGVVAATLNRLRGRPDVKRRARQARRIARRLGHEEAAACLGITRRALEQLLTSSRPPRPSSGGPGLDLHPVVFHLSSAEKDQVQEALHAAGVGKLRRAQALLKALGKDVKPGARRTADQHRLALPGA